MNINTYIKESWCKTIKSGNGVPFPFNSPCITDKMFLDFYYWDVYFVNKGLYFDGLIDQAENNINNIDYFINLLGFMPNSNKLTNSSQPPFFTRMVFDLYKAKNDLSVLEKYLPSILKEYNFWMTKRILPCGLNRYGEDATKRELLKNYKGLCDRVLEYRDTKQERLFLAKDILAIAESGLDFNMRFATQRSKVDINSFISLDINCILFDVENIISEIFALLSQKENSVLFANYAAKRKKLINEFLFDKKSGLYLDFNFVDKCFSENITAVSFYPYAFGVSNDAEGAAKLLNLLECEHGLSFGRYRGTDAVYLQWDYPNMWAPSTFFAYSGLKNVGLIKDANRAAEKYCKTIEDCFNKTGKIWEKYNAITGETSVVATEYDTPEMLGWSAGVFRFFEKELLKQ